MGTKGSYTGGGGKAGQTLRDELDDWLATPPDASTSESPQVTPQPSPPGRSEPKAPSRLPRLNPDRLLGAVGMFRPRSQSGSQADGPAGGGGALRSVAQSASTGARAGAGARAYRTGDAETLEALGLDYDALQGLGDTVEVVRKIVEAACGPLADGTIEDEERRLVAAEVAQWVLEANEGGSAPEPDEIAREAIARILCEAVATEFAVQLRQGRRDHATIHEAEREIREAAEALAGRADLSATGPSSEEFETAIENGLETLRAMWEVP